MVFEIIFGALAVLSFVCAALIVWCGHQSAKAKAEHDEINAAWCDSLERIFTVLLCVCLIHMLGYSLLDRISTSVIKIISAMEGLH